MEVCLLRRRGCGGFEVESWNHCVTSAVRWQGNKSVSPQILPIAFRVRTHYECGCCSTNKCQFWGQRWWILPLFRLHWLVSDLWSVLLIPNVLSNRKYFRVGKQLDTSCIFRYAQPPELRTLGYWPTVDMLLCEHCWLVSTAILWTILLICILTAILGAVASGI